MRSLHPPARGHRAGLATCAVAGTLAIAACGSAAGTSGHTGGRAAFLAFSVCMRAHGVPNFPDPGAGGGINLAPGLNPSAPSFQAAQSKCWKLLPGGGPPRGVSEQQKEQMVRTSQCMRAHGVSGFPDPTTQQPADPQADSIVTGIGGPDGGLFLVVPSTIDVNSPVFRQAASACHFG